MIMKFQRELENLCLQRIVGSSTIKYQISSSSSPHFTSTFFCEFRFIKNSRNRRRSLLMNYGKGLTVELMRYENFIIEICFPCFSRKICLILLSLNHNFFKIFKISPTRCASRQEPTAIL